MALFYCMRDEANKIYYALLQRYIDLILVIPNEVRNPVQHPFSNRFTG